MKGVQLSSGPPIYESRTTAGLTIGETMLFALASGSGAETTNLGYGSSILLKGVRPRQWIWPQAF